MKLFSNRLVIVVLSFLLPILCETETFKYPVHNFSKPPVSATAVSHYNSFSKPLHASAYYNQLGQRYTHPYESTAGLYSFYDQTTLPPTWNSIIRSYETATPSNGYYHNSISRIPSYKSTTSGLLTSKQYLSNSYNSENLKQVGPGRTSAISNESKKRVSKADSENSKFVGAENQEPDDEGGRTLHLKLKKKFRHRFGTSLTNPCSPYRRNAGNNVTPPPKEQGRFLWDVYNLYPQATSGLGCGGYGDFGGGLGAGLLSDPINTGFYPPGTGIVQFLSLFAPGVLQNSLASVPRPEQFPDYGQSSLQNDLESDPEVDPNYKPAPVRQPNRVFYDSVGAPPIPPSKLVGGISATVNDIIQRLTGNFQPVG